VDNVYMLLLFSDALGLLIYRQQHLWYHDYTFLERISHIWSKYTHMYIKNITLLKKHLNTIHFSII